MESLSDRGCLCHSLLSLGVPPAHADPAEPCGSGMRRRVSRPYGRAAMGLTLDQCTPVHTSAARALVPKLPGGIFALLCSLCWSSARHRSSIAPAPHWYRIGTTPVLLQHCSGTALAPHWHCTGTASAPHWHCTGTASVPHRHCFSTAPAPHRHCSSTTPAPVWHRIGTAPAPLRHHQALVPLLLPRASDTPKLVSKPARSKGEVSGAGWAEGCCGDCTKQSIAGPRQDPPQK